MVTIEQMLKEAIARDASDIFLVAGHPYAFKINGEIHSMQETRLMPNDTAQLIQEIYQYALQNTYEDFLKKKDDDFKRTNAIRYDELKALKELLDNDIITKEEFEIKKKEFLGI